MESFTLINGRVHVYKRPGSPFWQCSTYLAGKNRRASTKHETAESAKKFAEDWYFDQRAQHRPIAPSDGSPSTPAPTKPRGPTFGAVAEIFERECEIMTAGLRGPEYVKNHKLMLQAHLLPFFGDTAVSQVTSSAVQNYRVHRAVNCKTGKPPARSTITHELTTLRHVLSTAQRHGLLESLPDLSPPFKPPVKITHRAWFSKQEYRQFYEATRERAKNPKKEIWRWECEQLHDYVLFMANTGLRPDEAARLQYRDVKIAKDREAGQTILEIEVRGKRGVGHCKSMPGAIGPFLRLRKRNQPAPTDHLFPGNHRALFNAILDELGLKFDRDNNRRTAYSLRHSYICFRLMEGADIYQLAKNCRTSVDMIEKHYAAHLKNTLDAGMINIRRPTPPRRPRRKPEEPPPPNQ